MSPNEIARQVVDAAYRIHVDLGPGLLESVYEAVLAQELRSRGLQVATQQDIPIVYKGLHFDVGYRADLVVDEQVIVEVKSVDAVLDVHKKQLLTYLKMADKRLGLLVNFHSALIRDGITRIVNGLEDTVSRKDAKAQR